ncbi:MAG: DUF3793 family protein [Ruminococcus sp.]|nr:DUF3793 family protein [Ruminococcus sp.]
MSLEQSLILHCAPTLASLKPASLFTIETKSPAALNEELRQWNRTLRPKGLFLCILRQSGRNALVYVCRMSHLEQMLRKPELADFLSGYGYEDTAFGKALGRLKKRLSEGDGFPHEIGVFLGYPLEDVVGFIQSGGRNCKCVGCWKVYGDEAEARRKFAQYKKCSCVYQRLWGEGRSVAQLTVAA